MSTKSTFEVTCDICGKISDAEHSHRWYREVYGMVDSRIPGDYCEDCVPKIIAAIKALQEDAKVKGEGCHS